MLNLVTREDLGVLSGALANACLDREQIIQRVVVEVGGSVSVLL